MKHMLKVLHKNLSSLLHIFDFVAGFAVVRGKNGFCHPLISDLLPANATFKYTHKMKAKDKEVFLS